MLQQGQELDESQWDIIRRTLHLRRNTPAAGSNPDSATSSGTSAPAVPEPMLVAMGALHAVFGDDWPSWVDQEGEQRATLWPTLWPTLWQRWCQNPAAEAAATSEAVRAALFALQDQLPPDSWPPNPAQRAAFEQMLQEVRIGVNGER